MKQSLSYPITLTGKKPGKKLVILAGVHGNEQCGIRAFETVLPNLAIEAGEVTFAIGNPEAVQENKRFIDANLNRMFAPPELLSPQDLESHEYARAEVLKPLLQSCNALLDIHSSNTDDAPPFIICEPHSYPIAKTLPVSFISSKWDTHEPGGTDYFVNSQGGNGICVECGYNNDPSAIDIAIESIYSFLETLGATSPRHEKKISVVSHTYVPIFSLYKTKANFQPVRAFKDFEPISHDELIGIDGDTEVRAPQDCLVLFVRERMKSGEEAFLLAREEK